jgi:hypothetical protein
MYGVCYNNARMTVRLDLVVNPLHNPVGNAILLEESIPCSFCDVIHDFSNRTSLLPLFDVALPLSSSQNSTALPCTLNRAMIPIQRLAETNFLPDDCAFLFVTSLE